MSRFAPIGLSVLFASLLANSATSAPSESRRYPYDPACPWGRIADGKGMLVRCLTAEEVKVLATAAPASVANPANSIASTREPTSSPSPPSPTPNAGTATPESFVSELIDVVAEEGDLPLAKRKLGIPLARYALCVGKNGGLEGAVGQVEVKFLVRERGRAEGATVAKSQGVSEAAARCIADVIDRRPTGTPEAPIVSATATIRIRRKMDR